MTENEATREMTFDEEYEILQREKEQLFSNEEIDCEPPFANCVVRRALRCIRKLLEEFKDLKEKSVAKKPITYKNTNRADCPNCGATVRGIDKPFGDYCSKCGVKLDWSE